MVYERGDTAMHGEKMGFQCMDWVNQGSPWKDGELSLPPAIDKSLPDGA